MFPKFSSMLSRKKDSNKADAILIANYHHNITEKNKLNFIFIDKFMTHFSVK